MPQPPAFTGPEICGLSAFEVVGMLQKGEVSAVEVLDASLQRIEQVEPAINAMPTTCPDRARASVSALQTGAKSHPGWLAGLPIGIKDLDRVKGVRTTFGTKAMADHVPDYSEHFVELLEDRGGIVVGKTNTPELGAGGNTFNKVFGKTRNPWNTSLTAAGSSGGAAASLAAGETWLSSGSDNAGSLRTPAAYCGIVGLRPTPGRVTISLPAGASAGFSIEGVQGPMARNVRDCALFLDAMSGFNPGNPISFPAPVTPFQQAVHEADTNVRIAFAPDLNGFSPVETDIAAMLAKAMTRIEAAGSVVVEDCPDLPNLYKTYNTLRGIGYLTSNSRVPESISRHYKKTIKDNIEFGRSLTVQEIADSNLDRTHLFYNMTNFLKNFDVLACPTVGCMPRSVEDEWIDEINGEKLDSYIDWLRFAFLATTTGLPAISIPVGIGPNGMPVGLQLIGPPRGEAKLLAVAQVVETALGGPLGPIDPNITH